MRLVASETIMLDIDISIKKGSFNLHSRHTFTDRVTGIIGASGSGKSTLLAAISGLITPDSGFITLNHQRLFSKNERLFIPSYQRRIGLIFQDRQLFPHLTVQQNLLYGFNHLKPNQRKFHPDQVIELLNVMPLLTRYPRTLSGGEQQRVAIGRAILYSPHLLLLDEPLSALDEPLKKQILAFLTDIKLNLNIPMIYVTHAHHELDNFADCILNIHNGKLHPFS